jgi:hypothetical protein
MESIGRMRPLNPADEGVASPQRVRRIVVVHEFGEQHLPRYDSSTGGRPCAEHGAARPCPAREMRGERPTSRGRHHRPTESWLDLAESALHSWPVTLRVTLLVTVLLTGTAAVAAAVGVVGQILLAFLALRAQRQHEGRLLEIQGRQETGTATS